jgi:microsomal dipeptidase-like Zn-dependent dipeptidase
MQIVTTPAQARQAIGDNKLAVVLGVEMHELSLDQITTLMQNYGVAHIIPIHLLNNSFGSTAIYSDQFNTENNFLLGGFYRAESDPCLSFRLGVPQELPTNGPLGAINPTNISASYFQGLAYPKSGGERNGSGLSPYGALMLNQLMYAHVLLDVAHMGEKSTKQTLDAAQNSQYPVMYSHGGLRDDDPATCKPQGSVSERSLGNSQALRIASLGGMIGLGTTGLNSTTPVDDFLNAYNSTLAVMAKGNGGVWRGVALGTDTNGLSPLISFDTQPTQYPTTVVATASPPAMVNATGLPRFPKMGNPLSTYNFATDGIANYGMLADFMQAINQRNNSAQAIQALYHSAEDFIEMWELAQNALVINPSSTITVTAGSTSGTVATTAVSGYQEVEPVKVGMQYAQTLQASGGTPPYNWSWNTSTSYPLPANSGLNLSSTGVISGVPTTAGAFTVNVSVTDSGAPAVTSSLSFVVNVEQCGTGTRPLVCGSPGVGVPKCIATAQSCP